ncbi:fungal-specific transcription factor domain-containing protein [Aspergillus heterothallicus]
MPPKTKRTRVGSACERCRHQKLKCDIQRPCTLCVRAGVDCQTGPYDRWKAVQTPQAGGKENRRRGRSRTSSGQPGSVASQLEPCDEDDGEPDLIKQPWSSSTMSLVEEAFHFHDSTTPDMSMTTALPGGQRQARSENSGSRNICSNERKARRLPVVNPRPQTSRNQISELVSLLPSREVAALLVDTYFDRVHWFILIFQQDDFRRIWQQMYDYPVDELISVYPNPGFIGTFLVVIGIALQYTGAYRRHLLEAHNVDPTTFEEKIMSTVRAKLLDIIALGSLEAVQTCVLLGTYYLFHGNPELAWPVCGCGLRIAQALGLHRRMSSRGSTTPELYRQYETRKRCWWAIYEIETFCSMSYGYPHGIKDSDCDVELLDPLARSSAGQSPATFDPIHQCPANLLSYKYLMSKLSILIKDALTGLYGLGSRGSISGRPDGSPNLQSLIRQVSDLDIRLQRWNAEIPDLLRLDTPIASYTSIYGSAEEMDRDIGASGPGFENYIYQLQALSLKLAYENARILVHRPLLAYKTVRRADNEIDRTTGNPTQNPFQLSMWACRDAALKTSELGTTHIFSLAADTYAASFLGIHTFTAGLTLCILSSIEHLSPQSYQSKVGLRQLMSMQAHLRSRSRSTLAAQGLDILKRLTRLVMEREFKDITSPEVEKAPFLSQNTDMDSNTARQDVTGNLPDYHANLPAEGRRSEETTVDFIENPAMSQALYDFDQGRYFHSFLVFYLIFMCSTIW